MKTNKYFKRIDKNIGTSLEGKKVLLLGATGGLGTELSYYLGYLKADLSIAGRDQKALNLIKENIKNNFNVDCNVYDVDYLNMDKVKSIIKIINENKFDIVINNIGIYRQPISFIGDFEKTYYINYVIPSFIFEQVKDSGCKLVDVGSISYTFVKLNYEDSQGLKYNLTNHYGNSKLRMMLYCYSLKVKGYDVALCHPGVANTNLFHKKNKAFNKLFYIFIRPLMKLLFMNSKKASLTILYALKEDFKQLERSGPRGLMQIWGYPKKRKLKEIFENCRVLDEIYDKTTAFHSAFLD